MSTKKDIKAGKHPQADKARDSGRHPQVQTANRQTHQKLEDIDPLAKTAMNTERVKEAHEGQTKSGRKA